AANFGSAVDGRDPEGVHDMRVATRRLRAILDLLGPALDASERARLAASARQLTRALGPVREIDVMRIALASLLEDADPLRAFAIEEVDARLAAERRRARARMIKRFARVDLEDFDERLRRTVASLREAAAAAEETGLARPSASPSADATSAAL